MPWKIQITNAPLKKKKDNLIISMSIKEMQNLVKIIPIKLQKTSEFY